MKLKVKSLVTQIPKKPIQRLWSVALGLYNTLFSEVQSITNNQQSTEAQGIRTENKENV